jgi:hypothetical protein
MKIVSRTGGQGIEFDDKRPKAGPKVFEGCGHFLFDLSRSAVSALQGIPRRMR